MNTLFTSLFYMKQTQKNIRVCVNRNRLHYGGCGGERLFSHVCCAHATFSQILKLERGNSNLKLVWLAE